MNDVLDFAIESTRRQAEICHLRWEDNDAQTRTGLVRDTKHPFAKEGDRRHFKYTPEAWAIAQRQPRTSEYVFPYDPKSVGAAFTRACHVLQIPDLRFHDGRHEGTCQLFERGYQIHEVTQFTLHESWAELKRYANLRPKMFASYPLHETRNPHVRRQLTPTGPNGLVGLLAPAVYQLRKISSTHQPRKLLASQPDREGSREATFESAYPKRAPRTKDQLHPAY